MGLFDTVIFSSPVRCPECGHEIDNVQTKLFGSTLQEYRVGDVVEACPVLSGVMRESLYCPQCHTQNQAIYFSVWHTLLVGTSLDKEEAEARITHIDRAELLDYLAAHQKRALQWHNRFARLYGELQTYHDFMNTNPPLGAEAASKDIRYFRIASYVQEADALAALIEGNKPTNPEDEEEVAPEP